MLCVQSERCERPIHLSSIGIQFSERHEHPIAAVWEQQRQQLSSCMLHATFVCVVCYLWHRVLSLHGQHVYHEEPNSTRGLKYVALSIPTTSLLSMQPLQPTPMRRLVITDITFHWLIVPPSPPPSKQWLVCPPILLADRCTALMIVSHLSLLCSTLSRPLWVSCVANSDPCSPVVRLWLCCAELLFLSPVCHI